MEIIVNVIGQKLKLETSLKNYIAGSQRFIKFIFNLNDEWNGLTTFAQFIQNGTAYNAYLATVDGVANCAYLPPEIQAGECRLLLYGSGGATRATTNYLTLEIDENILVRNASSTEISQPLYDQLVTRFNQAIVGKTFTAQSSSDMTDTTKIYVYVGATTSSLTYGDWYYHNGTQWVSGGQYIAQTFIVGDNLEMVNGELRLIDDVIVNTGLTSYGYVSASTFVSAVQTIFAGETIFIGNPFVPNEIREVITYYKADELPTGNNIKQKTIYCIPNDNGGHDKYIYIPVAGKAEADCWEMLGGIENATADSKGSVQIGDGLNVDDGVVSVNTGTGLDIDDGAVVVDTDIIATKQYADLKADTAEQNAKEYVDGKTGNATKQSKGVMQVGDGLNVNDGTVSVDTNTIATKSSVDTIANKTSILTKDANGNAKFSGGVYANDKELATKEYVDSEVDTAVSDKITFVEVEQLPTGANIAEKTIYCVPDGDGGHDKYIYIPVQGKQEEDCWEQLGGGGGGSVVLGVTEENGVLLVDSKPTVGKDGVDYYIPVIDDQDEIVAYTHEIWISNPDDLVNHGAYYPVRTAGIDEVITAIQEDLDSAQLDIEAAKEDAQSALAATSGINSLTERVKDLEDNESVFGTDISYSNGILFLTNDGNRVGDGIEITIGGGGGGEVQSTVDFSIQNRTGWLRKIIAKDTASCVVRIAWKSVDKNTSMDTGLAYMQLIVGSEKKVLLERVLDPDENKGVDGMAVFEINVAPYVTETNTGIPVQVKVTNSEGDAPRSITFNIYRAALSIASTFDPSEIVKTNLQFPYIVQGCSESVPATVYFSIDGGTPQTNITKINDGSYTFFERNLTYGAHSIDCYCEATIDGVTTASNRLHYEFISSSGGGNNTIIAVTFQTDEYEIKNEHRYYKVMQYDTIEIRYQVYHPNYKTNRVTISADENPVEINVDRTIHSYSLRCTKLGDIVVTFSSGGTTKSVYLTVEADEEIESIAETAALELYLSSEGRSNNEPNPGTWVYDDIACEFSNFNFVSDGWVLDKPNNGIPALRVSGDARLYIPYQFFTGFSTPGKTIEVEFATSDVADLNATIIECTSDDGGSFTFTPQDASFGGSGMVPLSTQYKEDEHVRISFVVGPPTTGSDLTKVILVYVNGIASGMTMYEAQTTTAFSGKFNQTHPKGITIGSNDCTTDIYCIRAYNMALTRMQVLNNWIADTQDGTLMRERYTRNQIYVSGVVSPDKLPQYLPRMILIGDELPLVKADGAERTISVKYEDPLNQGKNFEADGVVASVQGTSSKDYARKNYDLKFKRGFEIGRDSASDRPGTHIANYALYDENGDKCLPFNRFVIKADVASSESVNNTGLTCYYNDIAPYKTAEMENNPMVRHGVYGFPIAVFWQKGNQTTFLGKYNFNLPKRAAYPYGYAGDDGNGNIVDYDERGEIPDDLQQPYSKMESWEFENNSDPIMKFLTDVFDMSTYTDEEDGNKTKYNWQKSFEARFPDSDYTDINKLSELVSFVYSTYRQNATNNDLPSPVTYRFDSNDVVIPYTKEGHDRFKYKDNSILVEEEKISVAGSVERTEYVITFTKDTEAYRLATFKAGIPEIMDIDSAIFYYIFTELFLMVDSRAKNMFIGFKGDPVSACPVTGATHIVRKAVLEPYDMDTAIGTNNSGELEFGHHYYLEDTDPNPMSIGKSIYNAQNSVLWCNIRDAFYDKTAAMYRDLRNHKLLSFDTVESLFTKNQSKWPEALWNEDAMFKYVWPYTRPDPGTVTTDESGNELSKKMLGSKAEQRKWWLYNRFRYMDSKWHAGDAIANNNRVTLRGTQTMDITITAFKNMYAEIEYGNDRQKSRVSAGESVTLHNYGEFTLDEFGNGEQIINIFSADAIEYLGDLSGLVLKEILNLGNAKNLKELIIGSDGTVINSILSSVSVGRNKMLKKLKARNCTALAEIQGLNNCTYIEEVDLRNTIVKSVETPDGGWLKKLYLPASVEVLSILNQERLSDFRIEGNSNLKNVTITGTYRYPSSNLDTKALLMGANNITRCHVENVDWELDDASLLLTLAGLDFDKIYESNTYWTLNNNLDLTGTILISKWTDSEKGAILKALMGITDLNSGVLTDDGANTSYTDNGLTLKFANSGNVSYHTVEFVDEDNHTICTQIVRHGENAIDPTELPVTSPRHIETPTKHKTRDKIYIFSGWNRLNSSGIVIGHSLENITTNTVFKVNFIESVRMYTVRFCYAGGATIPKQTYNNVVANSSVSYTGDPLEGSDPLNGSLQEGAIWIGFDRKTNAIYSDDDNDVIDVKALFIDPNDDSKVTPAVRPSTGIYYLYSDDVNDVSLYSLNDFYKIIYHGWASDNDGGDGLFSIGDRIKIIPTDNSIISDDSIVLWLVDFDYYENEKDGSHAKTLFHMKGLLDNRAPMSYTTPVEGYGAHTTIAAQPTLRDRLNGFKIGDTYYNGIYDILPIHWKNMIKTVKVPYIVGMASNSEDPTYRISNDKLFLLSSWECGAYGGNEDENYNYPQEASSNHTIRLYATTNYKVKGLGNKSYDPENPSSSDQGFDRNMTRGYWWTRSQVYQNRTHFNTCGTDGSVRYGYNEYDAKTTAGPYISFAFCI